MNAGRGSLRMHDRRVLNGRSGPAPKRRREGRWRMALPALALLAAGGCELQEIALAVPDDVIVAEVVLRAGEPVQRALLHRTGGGSSRVLGARVEVRERDTDRVVLYNVVQDSVCTGMSGPSAAGTCYGATTGVDGIRPGMQYDLRIDVEDRTLRGTTTVPGVFSVNRPGAPVCELAPRRTIETAWTRSAGAWVYVIEVRFPNLRQALRRDGIDVPGQGTVELTGLSIGAADTTLVFPTELGLFDRLDADLHPILVALADGLPSGVDAYLTVAATDRNYVNWVRGGAFNPSGLVRIPSVQGDGTGVFGSMVTVQRRLHTGTRGFDPPC